MKKYLFIFLQLFLCGLFFIALLFSACGEEGRQKKTYDGDLTGDAEDDGGYLSDAGQKCRSTSDCPEGFFCNVEFVCESETGLEDGGDEDADDGDIPDSSDDDDDTLDSERETGFFEASYISAQTAEALERAEQYLLKTVPGHAWHRLLTIYENGGDVAAAAEDLKAKIDDMVERLT